MGLSYEDILEAPGSAPVDQRTIEWLRDHGMSAFVDRGESWWLWRHLPSTTATITVSGAAKQAPNDRGSSFCHGDGDLSVGHWGRRVKNHSAFSARSAVDRRDGIKGQCESGTQR